MKIKTLSLGQLQTNCYLIINGASSVIIDPGVSNGELKALVTEQSLEKIDLILLTHFHFDHILGIGELKEFSDAPIAIHEIDADGLHDSKKNLSYMAEGQDYPPIFADRLFKDGDVIELPDMKIEVIHTPGHTAGSCCFIIENNLFSGDTLFKDFVGRTDMPSGDKGELISSLEKLKALEPDYVVYPGHGNVTTLSREKQHNRYMRDKK